MSEATQTTEVTNVPPASVTVPAPEQKSIEKTTETKVTEEKKTPEFMSEKFHQLARKEKSVVKARQEISQMKADFEKQQAQFKEQLADLQRWKHLRDNAKLDPESYLNEAGISYGSLTERNLKGGIDPNVIFEKTNQTIAQFKKEQEEAKKQAQEEQKTQAKKQYEQNLQNFVQGIHEFVETNKEKYELTSLHGQQHLIWEVIQEAGKRGTEMTVQQAAEKVENYLDQQVTKALASKKFKDKFVPVVKPEDPVKPSVPTLSNNITATTPVNGNRAPTEQERIANAMAVLNKFD